MNPSPYIGQVVYPDVLSYIDEDVLWFDGMMDDPYVVNSVDAECESHTPPAKMPAADTGGCTT